MTQVIYEFPKQAEYNRIVPKNKIYAKTKLSTNLKNKFVEQIDKIVWKYVLAPRAINLAKGKTVEEIAIFEINLRQKEIDYEVLHVIDKFIRVPVFFLLIYGDEIKMVSAYKRPSDADSSKWVVDSYFDSGWLSAEAPREPLPLALDMEKLYGKMLRPLMPLPPRAGETLKAQAERLAQLQNKQKEINKLETHLQREKQFNRKVEINVQLRTLKNEVDVLTAE